jgi:putative MATE family efflux protein
MSANTGGLRTDLRMGTEPVSKLVAGMAAPMVVAMVVNGLYYLVDAAFLGWGVGADGLAGLAIVFPPQMLLIALASWIATGTSAVLSLQLGRGDKAAAGRAVRTAVLFCLGLGVAIPAVMLAVQEPLLTALGATSATYLHAAGYYCWIMSGMVFVLLSFVGVNTARGEGNAKLAANAMVMGSVLNVVLDPLFIFGLNMGTAGAAVATVVARAITTVYLLRFYLGRKGAVDLWDGSWRPDIALLRRSLALGSGPFFNQICMSLLAVVMVVSLSRYGGPTDIAIYGVIGRIYIFVAQPLMGLAMGLQPVVGYNYGAGNPERVVQSVKVALVYAVVLGLAMFALLFGAPGLVMRGFTGDAALIAGGVSPLRTMVLVTPIVGVQLVSYFFFLAVGRGLYSLFISVSRSFLFLVPLVLVLPLWFGANGIWLAYPVADVVSVLVSGVLLQRALSGMRRSEPSLSPGAIGNAAFKTQ